MSEASQDETNVVEQGGTVASKVITISEEGACEVWAKLVVSQTGGWPKCVNDSR